MPRGSGRRPKPTKLKQLQGNPGHRPLNDAEPKPRLGRPDKPEGLVGEAAAEWDRIIPEIEAMGILTVVDRAALAAYCFNYARWFAAEKEVSDRGILIDEPIVDAEGNEVGTRTKKNPACTEVASALRLMHKFLVEFGLTPSSRSRLRLEQKLPEELNPFEKLLHRGQAASNAGTKPN